MCHTNQNVVRYIVGEREWKNTEGLTQRDILSVSDSNGDNGTFPPSPADLMGFKSSLIQFIEEITLMMERYDAVKWKNKPFL